MGQAVSAIGNVDFAYIDGPYVPKNVDFETQAVVKGDSKVRSIAAASIIAKVFLYLMSMYLLNM